MAIIEIGINSRHHHMVEMTDSHERMITLEMNGEPKSYPVIITSEMLLAASRVVEGRRSHQAQLRSESESHGSYIQTHRPRDDLLRSICGPNCSYPPNGHVHRAIMDKLIEEAGGPNVADIEFHPLSETASKIEQPYRSSENIRKAADAFVGIMVKHRTHDPAKVEATKLAGRELINKAIIDENPHLQGDLRGIIMYRQREVGASLKRLSANNPNIDREFREARDRSHGMGTYRIKASGERGTFSLGILRTFNVEVSYEMTAELFKAIKGTIDNALERKSRTLPKEVFDLIAKHNPGLQFDKSPDTHISRMAERGVAASHAIGLVLERSERDEPGIIKAFQDTVDFDLSVGGALRQSIAEQRA